MKIDPNAPAYPLPTSDKSMPEIGGLPIRLELAARMMVAIIADPLNENCDYSMDAKSALAAADDLIAAYNEGQP